MRIASCIVAFSSLAFLLGCGGGGNPNTPADATGKVTYKGQPVTGGTITFHSKDAGITPGVIAADGTYSVVGLPVSELVVTIETDSLKRGDASAKYGGGKGKSMMSKPPEGANTGGGGAYVAIPAKYKDASKSGITFTPIRGKQTKDFVLAD